MICCVGSTSELVFRVLGFFGLSAWLHRYIGSTCIGSTGEASPAIPACCFARCTGVQKFVNVGSTSVTTPDDPAKSNLNAGAVVQGDYKMNVVNAGETDATKNLYVGAMGQIAKP